MAALGIIGVLGLLLNLVQLTFIIKRIRSKNKLAMDFFLISLTVGDIYRSSAATIVHVYLVGYTFITAFAHIFAICELNIYTYVQVE